MASDSSDRNRPGGAHALTPIPRARAEVSFNERAGTMSRRTTERPTNAGTRRQTDGSAHRTPEPAPEHAPWSARAAALRSTGPAPSRGPAKGAAPIPTHPAAVRAAVGVDLASLTPEQRQRHLAGLGALRSGGTADPARGTRTPTAVASRLRSTSATPVHTHTHTHTHTHAHAHAAERAASAITRTRAPGVPQGPGPAAGPRR
ncbi:hypothetical protein [Streptomyces adelaidensis]|uniref:hypothetical protein n=1 Tax=Streptomyces adelaidensis TaxID=2796465 RepID=UPI00190364E5|nr:hypothetical protein [Streptomyces adelaidensis]